MCNDGSGSEAHTSIHSFDGDVENLTIEDLAYHELGETKQVRFQYKMSLFSVGGLSFECT